jgi:DNA-binding NarL/FixJ family response regulator
MSVSSLTHKQRAVFTLIASGRSIKMAGAEIGVSPKTVEHHWAAVKRKLGVQTPVEAAHLALHRKAVKNLFEL